MPPPKPSKEPELENVIPPAVPSFGEKFRDFLRTWPWEPLM